MRDVWAKLAKIEIYNFLELGKEIKFSFGAGVYTGEYADCNNKLELSSFETLGGYRFGKSLKVFDNLDLLIFILKSKLEIFNRIKKWRNCILY